MYNKYLNLSILQTRPAQPEENMAEDTRLLAALDPEGPPLLHLYEWASPSATYGHFIDPKVHLNLEAAARCGLKLARRPTGGGIVFHIWDLAFSFLMPAKHPLCSEKTLDNYHFVNQAVLDALEDLLPNRTSAALLSEHTPTPSFCMARATIYDVLYGGKKIAGAAQRRTKNGYLHQGSISLVFPDLQLLKELLVMKDEIIAAMMDSTCALSMQNGDFKDLAPLRKEVQERLKHRFNKLFS